MKVNNYYYYYYGLSALFLDKFILSLNKLSLFLELNIDDYIYNNLTTKIIIDRLI